MVGQYLIASFETITIRKKRVREGDHYHEMASAFEVSKHTSCDRLSLLRICHLILPKDFQQIGKQEIKIETIGPILSFKPPKSPIL